jgi:hypothetical protein
LQSAPAAAKILRLNADAAALRGLRFTAGDPLGSSGRPHQFLPFTSISESRQLTD